MGRPRKEGLDYFPHDCDASSDEKIEALRALFGNDGYAVFFILLERIYRCATLELPISAPEIRQIVAHKCGVSVERFDQIVDAAIRFGCFDAEAYQTRGVLTSDSIKRRASVVLEKRQRMRERYAKVSADKTGEETGAETPQRKEKESKVKQSKVLEDRPSQSVCETPAAEPPSDPPDPDLPKRGYVYRDEHMALAQRLADLMRQNKPTVRLPARLDAWANVARLMTDVDHRTVERIAEVIDWCQHDEFWRTNILSMGKLREQFDQLELKMEKQRPRREATDPAFDAFMAVYPRKAEKEAARAAWQARLNQGHTAETMLQAARNYAAYVRREGTEERYIKLPATFLGETKPFLDWLKPREPTEAEVARGQEEGRPEPIVEDPESYRAQAQRLQAELRARG